MSRRNRLRRLNPTNGGQFEHATSVDSIIPVPGRLTTFSSLSTFRRLVFEPLESRRMLAADCDFSVVANSEPCIGDVYCGEWDEAICFTVIGEDSSDADGTSDTEAEDAAEGMLASEDAAELIPWVEDDAFLEPLMCGWFGNDEYVVDEYVDEYITEESVAEDRVFGEEVVSESDEWIADEETFLKFWDYSEFGPHFSLCIGSSFRDYWTDSTILISSPVEDDVSALTSLDDLDSIAFASGTFVSGPMVLRGVTLSLVGVADFPGELVLSGVTLDEQAPADLVEEELVEDFALAGEEVSLDELAAVEVAFSTGELQVDNETVAGSTTDNVTLTPQVPRPRDIDPAVLAQVYSMFGGFRESVELAQPPFGGRRGSRR